MYLLVRYQTHLVLYAAVMIISTLSVAIATDYSSKNNSQNAKANVVNVNTCILVKKMVFLIYEGSMLKLL